MEQYPNQIPETPEENERAYPAWMRYVPKKKERRERSYSLIDTVFALLSFPVAFLAVRATPVDEYPLGALITTVLILTFGVVYARLNGNRLRLRGMLFLAVAALFSMAYVTNGNETVLFWVSVFLAMSFCAVTYDLCGLAGKRLDPDHIPSHLIRATLRLPFSHIGAVFGGVKQLGRHSVRMKNFGKSIKYVAIGLVVAMIPTTVVWALLSYDEGFNAILKDLRDQFSFSTDGLWETVGDLILCVPVAMLLFGAVYGFRSRAAEVGEEAPLELSRLHRLPLLLLSVAVTPILLLYVIFFISQWKYYVSAFTHVLPEGLTYADYAREGFFQLCAVCGINAVILLLFCLLARKKDGNRRSVVTSVYAFVISLFTLILIATALSKMLLYIDSYGLTQKRVYASWFMILLALVFICVALRQIVRRFPAMTVALIGAVALFGLIAVPNVDAVIADYNVSAYLSGELSSPDANVLAELGVSSVPARVRLEKALLQREERSVEEEVLLLDITNSLDRDAKRLETADSGFFSTSIPRAQAQKSLSERG